MQQDPARSRTGNVPHKDGDHTDTKGDHKDGDHKEGAGHEHKPGAHGGIIVSLGKDSYHAEAVFEKDGAIRLYLRKDEIKPRRSMLKTLSLL